MYLDAEGEKTHILSEGDAYVIPPQMKHQISNFSQDLSLLEVSLPGDFETTFY